MIVDVVFDVFIAMQQGKRRDDDVDLSLFHGVFDCLCLEISQPYVIVTVAKGATIAGKNINARATGFKTSASGDPLGAGASGLGLTSKFETDRSNDESTGESSDFVLAYSVNEIYYRRMTHTPLRKGEVQSIEDDDGTEFQGGAPMTMIETVVVDDMNEENYWGGDEDGGKEEAWDARVSSANGN
ncbi:hypothetical protein V8C43DRAFT_300218 [Trichoderma afarasin]